MLANVTVVIVLCGCHAGPKAWEPNKDGKEKKTFFFPVRQLPPQSVYNRLREVRPPSVLPSSTLSKSKTPKILPVLHLELESVSLEEAAKVLAESARYSYYCSSIVADKRVSINSLGTIDELGQEIAQKAGIDVVVDHSNTEVRFLAGSLHPKAPLLP
jgi:hypothetical protein